MLFLWSSILVDKLFFVFIIAFAIAPVSTGIVLGLVSALRILFQGNSGRHTVSIDLMSVLWFASVSVYKYFSCGYCLHWVLLAYSLSVVLLRAILWLPFKISASSSSSVYISSHFNNIHVILAIRHSVSTCEFVLIGANCRQSISISCVFLLSSHIHVA